jgi:Zn-dependent protease
MVEIGGRRQEELASLALQFLSEGRFQDAYQVLSELISVLPDSSAVRSGLLQALSTFSFHLSSGSVPPPQLIARLATLVRQLKPIDVTPAPVPNSSARSSAKKLGPIGILLAFLVKFKTIGLLLLTKGKLLLLGLTNIKALISILAFLGIYWAMYGWWFAVGFFASIFVHEMGHYVTVRRYGFAADAPVFVPFVGAFVKWQGANVDPVVRAKIALAGPLFGFAAAIGCYGVFSSTGAGVWLALAHVGAFINLLNLIPVFIFDGGAAFIALGKQERIAVLIISLALWFFLSETIFLFIALGAGYRLFKKDFAIPGSQPTAYYFVGLLIGLGLFDWWILEQAKSVFSRF